MHVVTTKINHKYIYGYCKLLVISLYFDQNRNGCAKFVNLKIYAIRGVPVGIAVMHAERHSGVQT